MVLLLTVMQSPNSALGEQRLIQASGFVIGRGSDCDWTLPDPDRRISNRHCAVELFEGQWHLRDLSSNGTFLNTTPEPIGRGQMRPLRYGDRIRLGAYELECRLQVDAASARSHGKLSLRPGPNRAARAAWRYICGIAARSLPRRRHRPGLCPNALSRDERHAASARHPQ